MSKKFLVGFIAGAVAGTVTGILLASEKGVVVRHKLAGKIGDCFDKLKNSLGLDSDNHADEVSEWEHAERPYTPNHG